MHGERDMVTSDSHTQSLLTQETPAQSTQRRGHETAQSVKSGRTSLGGGVTSEGSTEDSFQITKLELIVAFGAVSKGPGQAAPPRPPRWGTL